MSELENLEKEIRKLKAEKELRHEMTEYAKKREGMRREIRLLKHPKRSGMFKKIGSLVAKGSEGLYKATTKKPSKKRKRRGFDFERAMFKMVRKKKRKRKRR